MYKRPNGLLAVLLVPAMLMLPPSGLGPDRALADVSTQADGPTATLAEGLLPPDRASTAVKLELERCLLTVHFLYEPDANRFVEEGYVPEGYTPAKVANLREPLDPLAAARLEIWAFSCGHVRVGGGEEAPGMFTLVSIPIEDRPAHEHWAGISDNYLVWAHTDRADIARAVGAVGIPASLVEDMTFDWRLGPLNPSEGATGVRVPWAPSPYEVGVRGLPGTNSPHYHDNTFQHADPSRGKSSLELHVLIPPAQDLLCVPTDRELGADGWDGDPACGVKAEPGTEMARLLGDNPKTAEFDPTTKTGAAADHDMVWKATMTIVMNRS